MNENFAIDHDMPLGKGENQSATKSKPMEHAKDDTRGSDEEKKYLSLIPNK